MPKRHRHPGRLRSLLGEDGATIIEYGLLITFVALACVVAITALGNSLKVPFQNAVTGLS